jgi:EAL domain-containing protein (putative c-di-GMP-specific phosphodiesterase class I)
MSLDTLSSGTPGPAGPAAAARHDEEWVAALQRLLAEPQCVRVHYQPIVDLQRGIVRGYEALARFPEAPGLTTRDPFTAAARLGFAGALEAQLLQAALVTRPLLVRDRFVAVNVSPAALLSDAVRAVLTAERSLEQLVVELVDQDDDGADGEAVTATLAELRKRGAMVAVHVAGGESRSLDRVAVLRPHFVKADGALVARIEQDEACTEIIRALCAFATRLDAWVVAEGIETGEQLDALAALGAPLGQGLALGRPVAAMGELDRDVARRMRRRSLGGTDTERIAGLGEAALVVPAQDGTTAVAGAFAADPDAEYVVVLTPDGRPGGIIDRLAHERGAVPGVPLCLDGVTPVADAARRAMARPLATRFAPIVLLDPRGGYAGVVAIDRMVGALAR